VTGRRSAQAVVEFALTLPLLLLLLLGVVDAGRGVVAANSLSNAAREGARYLAVHLNEGTCVSPNCQVEVQTVLTETAQAVDSSQIQTDVSVMQGIANLTLSYPFQPVSPFISSVFGSPTLTASSHMHIR